jgi:hypothetical protein
MTNGKGFCAIFTTARWAFAIRSVVEANVVNFVPLVQTTQHAKRSYLPTARCGMQVVGLQPQDLHRRET